MSPALEGMDSGVWRQQDSSIMRSDGREQQTRLQRSQAGFPPRAEGTERTIPRYSGDRGKNRLRSSLLHLPVYVHSVA